MHPKDTSYLPCSFIARLLAKIVRIASTPFSSNSQGFSPNNNTDSNKISSHANKKKDMYL